MFLCLGIMRVIITARSSLVDGYDTILSRLVNILGVISKNPSNPNFDQYIFESISALIRYSTLCVSYSLVFTNTLRQVHRCCPTRDASYVRTGLIRTLYFHTTD